MNIDTIDALGLSVESSVSAAHLEALHQSFNPSRIFAEGVIQRVDPSVDDNLARMLGISDITSIATIRPLAMETIHQLMDGIDIGDYHTLGLKEINAWNINKEFYYQTIRAQAGYAAEVISTWKENLVSRVNGSDIITYRADDRPDLFPRNDQYIDKVRMDSNGNIIERIQTKFVGGNGQEWLSKLMSAKFDKYFDGAVDKIECPKDYYKEIKELIPQRNEYYQRQLDRVIADGKTDVAQSLQRKIDKLNQLNTMVEQSTVTSDEAVFARMHPRLYSARMFIEEIHYEGLKSGLIAAGLTFAISTVENVSSFVDGKITALEMMVDVVEDTASAGALGYGTAFITAAVSQAMRNSSNALIQSIGGSCLPAAIASFAVESFNDIVEYTQGKIDGLKLAYNLGENASKVAGGMIGGAKLGAFAGSFAGPAGSVVGGIVGGMIGCVLATELYKTAVTLGTEGANILAEKANEFANRTMDSVSEFLPDKLQTVKDAFNDFFDSTKEIVVVKSATTSLG